MKLKRHIIALTSIAGLLAMACHAPYTMKNPESFKRYEESRQFKLITANGIRLMARQVDNYPKATLAFWVDAMVRHMDSQGYVVKSNECFKTDEGREGCTIELMLPHGAADWVMSETLFVVGDEIVIVEAAGPYDLYAKVEPQLKSALKTFRPNL